MTGSDPPNPSPDPPPDDASSPAAGTKRKRNLPGTPDPDAEVVALSPKTLLAAATFACEVCGKEFRRDQNLQIHRRGHNLPWRAAASERPRRRRVYVCPEATCVYHDASRALGDLTGIKKHYSRKHGEKRWGCDRCDKRYAVRTDWKAHVRVCGSREYECPCGTLFSRKESFMIHRAACESSASAAEAAEESGSGGFRANAVNHELLFPSLWGRASEEELPESSADHRAN